MGGSHVKCVPKANVFSSVIMSCATGRIDTDNTIFGVMSSELDNHYYCTEASIMTDPSYQGSTNCTSHVDVPEIKNRIKQSCFNKTSCTLNIDDYLLADTPASIGGNNGVCGHNSYFYVQYPCLIPEPQKIIRRIFGLTCGSLVVFVYLFVVIYFDYIKCVQMNTYVDWDVKTITAGDYSIEFDLHESTYEKF